MSRVTGWPHAFCHRFGVMTAGKWSSCIRRVRIALDMNIKYQYRDFSIELPAEHLFPSFQEKHKLYDRFLPHLCKYLAPGSTILDVGANCGYSLAAMYNSNKRLVFVCVEPDNVFVEFLRANARRIREGDREASITIIDSLVGKQIQSASLEGSGGTRRAVVSERAGCKSSKSVDDILAQCKCASVTLLKSDVDGFDYDVIDSAELLLDSCAPMIFFECQFDQASQKAGYERTISSLAAKGYIKWIIFDNYGEVVLRTNDMGAMGQLCDYLWRQNIGRSTRTIWYYDVLAATAKDGALVDKVIDDYIAEDVGVP